MEQNRLKFFKTIKKMIDTGSTCSEILDYINKQSEEIKSKFSDIEIRTLKRGGDKVLKELFSKFKTASSIRGFPSQKEIKNSSSGLNDFDRFDIFIKDKIKELEN